MGSVPVFLLDAMFKDIIRPLSYWLTREMIMWRIWKMIEIIPLDGSQSLWFENCDQLFAYITETENKKLLSKRAYPPHMDWSFTIYPTKQVAALYAYHMDPDESIKEAYIEELSLIEICAGSYQHPTYIVYTPNVDMDFLKIKWCLDFCTYHDLLLRDYSQIYKRKCFINMECSTYII
jgi:hypothetical protein